MSRYEHDLIRDGFVRLNTVEACMIVSDGFCTYVPILPETAFEKGLHVPEGFRLFHNNNHQCYAILQHDMYVKPLFKSVVYERNKWRYDLANRKVWASLGSKEHKEKGE